MSQKLEVAIDGNIKKKGANTGSLTVITDKQTKKANQLYVGFTAGTGENYHSTEEAQVSVWFEGKPIFNGTFELLNDLLTVHGYPRTIIGTYDMTFKLHLITQTHVFYCCEEEGDENANTMIFTRNMELLSNNYFAFNALFEECEKNEGIIWACDMFRMWQKEQFPGTFFSTALTADTYRPGWTLYDKRAKEVMEVLGHTEELEEVDAENPITAVYVSDRNYWIAMHRDGRFSTVVMRESEYGTFEACVKLIEQELGEPTTNHSQD